MPRSINILLLASLDLLLFYPILLITGVLGIAFGLASRKSESGSGS
jgi:hypothetical protein